MHKINRQWRIHRIEANDMGAVHGLALTRSPLLAARNIYNQPTLAVAGMA